MKVQLNQKGFSAFEGLLIMVIVGIIGGTGYFVYQGNKQVNENYRTSDGSVSFAKKKTPTSFNECKAAAGSVILKTSPEQCKTKSGKTFTDTTKTKAATTIDDKAAIVAAITAYIQKTSEPGTDLTNFKYPADEITINGTSAKGILRASVGDSMNYYAQKQNDTWQIIYLGHLQPSDNATCLKYNLPSAWCGPY